MSDHQNGGGLPVVGILGVLVVLPVAGWLFFSASAAPTSAPAVPIHTPSTSPIPIQQAGSSIEPGEEIPKQIEASQEDLPSPTETTEVESTSNKPSVSQ